LSDGLSRREKERSKDATFPDLSLEFDYPKTDIACILSVFLLLATLFTDTLLKYLGKPQKLRHCSSE